MPRNLVIVIFAHSPAQGWRVALRSVLDPGLGIVFASQLAEALLRHKVVGASRQAAASVGLLSEKKGLRHRALTQQGGSPVSGLSAAGASQSVADDGAMLRRLCLVGDIYCVRETTH